MSTEPISQTGVAPNVQFMVNIRAVPLTGPSGPIETMVISISNRTRTRVPLTGPSGPIETSKVNTFCQSSVFRLPALRGQLKPWMW